MNQGKSKNSGFKSTLKTQLKTAKASNDLLKKEYAEARASIERRMEDDKEAHEKIMSALERKLSSTLNSLADLTANAESNKNFNDGNKTYCTNCK